jgi:hypothetical protein
MTQDYYDAIILERGDADAAKLFADELRKIRAAAGVVEQENKGYTNSALELAIALLDRVHSGTASLPGAAEKWAMLIQEAYDAQKKEEKQ